MQAEAGESGLVSVRVRQQPWFPGLGLCYLRNPTAEHRLDQPRTTRSSDFKNAYCTTDNTRRMSGGKKQNNHPKSRDAAGSLHRGGSSSFRCRFFRVSPGFGNPWQRGQEVAKPWAFADPADRAGPGQSCPGSLPPAGPWTSAEDGAALSVLRGSRSQDSTMVLQLSVRKF